MWPLSPESRSRETRHSPPRAPRLRRAVPGVVVIAVGLRQAVLEEGVVIVLLDMMGLQPDARGMDRLDMGGKAAVRLVDVGADVPGTGDHVLRIDARLLEVGLAVGAPIDLVERRGVAVDAVRPELGGHDRGDGLCHAVVVGRTRALDEMLALVTQPDGVG